MIEASPRVDWFFGRGLSIGCGLTWAVPTEWNQLSRENQIRRIKSTLRLEMDSPKIDCSDIKELLNLLSGNTTPPWRHLFLTTNWDCLLQREILNLQCEVQPAWLAETHVYHLNGTIEELPDNRARSPFLLEADSPDQRTSTAEANTAFSRVIWNQTFVVVGMSFECEIDKFLLKSLARVQDDLPIRESRWIVINPDASVLSVVAERLQGTLPCAEITPVESTFGSWLCARAPQLQECGALAF